MLVVEAKHLMTMHPAAYKWDWYKHPPWCLPQAAKVQEGLTSEI